MGNPDTPVQLEPPSETAQRIRIGCAGWGIPAQHRHLFNHAGSVLERYASRLPVVEINSSFHRPHQGKTYRRWAETVPKDFRFSVKIPKLITHDHGLLGTSLLVDQFLEECLELGEKLGGLLVQLPPGLGFDGRRANAFFSLLRRRVPARVAIACEPRHASWFGESAKRVWVKHEINRLAADPSPVEGIAADVPSNQGGWRYWRLHGAPRRYYSAYSHDDLKTLAPLLKHAAQTNDVWVIFDNTAQGYAVANAVALQDMLASTGY